MSFGIVVAGALAGCWSLRPSDGSGDGDITDGDGGGLGALDAGTDAPPDPEARAALERYCSDIADTSCAAFEACCEGGWTEGRRDRCRREVHDPCVRGLGPEVDRGDVTVDPAGAVLCHDAIASALATCPDESPEPALLPECLGAIRGTAETGGCCDGSQVCGYGTGCGQIDDCTCEEGATCRLLPGEGEPCLAGYQCARGLVCGSGTCATPLPEGSACDDEVCLGRCDGACVAEPWRYCEDLPSF